MSYVLGSYGLGAAAADVATACAEGCDSSFDNRVRKGKCAAACTTAGSVADCMSKCDSSFDTKGRKDKCKAVCQDAWATGGGLFTGGGAGGDLLKFAVPAVVIGVVGIVLWKFIFKKKAAA